MSGTAQYAFVAWIFTIIAYAVFIAWVLIPTEVLHGAGITYYPDKHYAIFLPSLLIVATILLIVCYIGLNMLSTFQPDDLRTFEDPITKYSTIFPYLGMNNPSDMATPDIADVNICDVSALLHNSTKKIRNCCQPLCFVSSVFSPNMSRSKPKSLQSLLSMQTSNTDVIIEEEFSADSGELENNDGEIRRVARAWDADRDIDRVSPTGSLASYLNSSRSNQIIESNTFVVMQGDGGEVIDQDLVTDYATDINNNYNYAVNELSELSGQSTTVFVEDSDYDKIFQLHVSNSLGNSSNNSTDLGKFGRSVFFETIGLGEDIQSLLIPHGSGAVTNCSKSTSNYIDELKQKKAENSKLNEKIKELESDNITLYEEIAELTKQLRETEQVNLSLSKSISSTNFEETKQANALIAKQLKEMTQKNTHLELVQQTLQDNFADLTSENERLRLENESLSSTLANLESKLERAQSESQLQRQDTSSNKQELNRVRMEISRVKHELEQQTAVVNDQAEQIVQLTREKDERASVDSKRIRDLESEKRRLEERIGYMQREADDIANQMSRALEERNAQDRRCIQAEADLSAMYIKLHSIESTESALRRNESSLIVQVRELSAANDRLMQQMQQQQQFQSQYATPHSSYSTPMSVPQTRVVPQPTPSSAPPPPPQNRYPSQQYNPTVSNSYPHETPHSLASLSNASVSVNNNYTTNSNRSAATAAAQGAPSGGPKSLAALVGGVGGGITDYNSSSGSNNITGNVRRQSVGLNNMSSVGVSPFATEATTVSLSQSFERLDRQLTELMIEKTNLTEESERLHQRGCKSLRDKSRMAQIEQRMSELSKDISSVRKSLAAKPN